MASWPVWAEAQKLCFHFALAQQQRQLHDGEKPLVAVGTLVLSHELLAQRHFEAATLDEMVNGVEPAS
jgi:hypothetical protein